jgi:hypothetical protein
MRIQFLPGAVIFLFFHNGKTSSAVYLAPYPTGMEGQDFFPGESSESMITELDSKVIMKDEKISWYRFGRQS